LSCSACGFQFKDPPIPEEKLLDCYARTGEGNWGLRPDPHERYFDVIREQLERHSPGRATLDIGCANGALLEWLGEGWGKFGVEPSVKAGEVAASRGVKIVGRTLSDCASDARRYDAAVAIDVMEHIAEPVPFVKQVRELLKPNGVFLVVTGDTSARTWHLLRNRYWYCSLVEHVSFYSEPAMHALATATGMRSVEHRRLSHQRTSWSHKIDDAAKNSAYLAGTATHWFGIKSLQEKFDRGAPLWLSARDHMFHVMRRA
jgi:cyclopropane fatty-acyl-phospholipid synthase-like methyltransferase